MDIFRVEAVVERKNCDSTPECSLLDADQDR